MKKILKSLAVLPVLLLAGCARENLSEGHLTIKSAKAELEEEVQTKAHLANGSDIVWDLGDVIGVFSDTQDAVSFYNISSGGSASSMFSGSTVSGNDIYAFYPFMESAFESSGRYILHFELPSPGSGPDPELELPMVAKLYGGVFKFRQTVGIIHFTIKGGHTIKYLSLKGNSGEKIAGSGTVDVREANPFFSLSGSATTDVATYLPDTPLTVAAGQQLDVYFPVPPMTFTSGLTLDICYLSGDTEEVVSKSTARSISVPRATIKNFTAVDIDELIDNGDDGDTRLTTERNALIALYKSTNGDGWTDKTNWCSDRPVGEWKGVYTDADGYVIQMDLYNNNLSGSLPDEIYDLTGLIYLDLGSNSLTGTLSSKIGKLTKLQYFYAEENQLSGNIPAELASLPDLFHFFLYSNKLSGTVSSAFANLAVWARCWGYVIYGNSLNMSNAMPRITDFSVSLTDGSSWSSSAVSSNKLTVLLQGATWCSYTKAFVPTVETVYNYFKDKGLDVVSWFSEQNGSTYKSIDDFFSEYGLNFKVFRPASDNTANPGISTWYPIGAFPIAMIYDNTGRMVWNSLVSSRSEFQSFIENYMGETISEGPGGDPDLYASTDFSRDGNVTVFQSATVGNGIDMVLMGDAYADKDIASGKYAADMTTAIENFFSEEPYTSFRNMFNVYIIDVVSLNNEYTASSSTAFSGYFGDGTTVGGEDSKVMEYAGTVLSNGRMNNALMVVIMNRDYYAGTCYMYGYGIGDYGYGPSVSYFPTYSNAEIFAGLIRHEAGGHGFAKLDDEYSYESMGTIPSSVIEGKHNMESYGWWKNVDFTSDPSAVKWSKYIDDPQYSSQNIGVYEGACTYWSGAWRPTVNSIMRHNTDGYNAPSREAIYYRLHKLAYGDSWEYDHGSFTSWDSANCASAGAPAIRPNCVEVQLPPLAPPVVREWNGVPVSPVRSRATGDGVSVLSESFRTR